MSCLSFLRDFFGDEVLDDVLDLYEDGVGGARQLWMRGRSDNWQS